MSYIVTELNFVHSSKYFFIQTKFYLVASTKYSIYQKILVKTTKICFKKNLFESKKLFSGSEQNLILSLGRFFIEFGWFLFIKKCSILK